MSWVYAVRIGTAVKVGCTRTPSRRLTQLSAASGLNASHRPAGLDLTDVEPLLLVEGDRRTEKVIHALIAEHRIGGEWYCYEPLRERIEMAAKVGARWVLREPTAGLVEF